VEFGPLSEPEIAAYVASGEPMGRAGAYAIQGRAGAFIARISGSYSSVMGLPLFETADLLRRFGIVPA
jgi:septum formation protein